MSVAVPPLSRVVVADDHPMFRAALVHALAGLVAPGGVVEAASLGALEAAVADGPAPDLVLLDLAMPGANGFSSLVRLRSGYPQLPVLVVSSNDHAGTQRRARQFGAAGFVSKAAPAPVLHAAVRAVMAGDTWFDAAQDAHADHSARDAELAQRLAQLTPQQLRVLMLVAEGLLNKQIADQLGLSTNTVKIHVTAVLSKLQCRSRTQAAVLMRSLELDADVDGGSVDDAGGAGAAAH